MTATQTPSNVSQTTLDWWEQLGPWKDADLQAGLANQGYSLLTFLDTIGAQLAVTEAYTRDDATHVGWGQLLDVNVCPTIALPWLAQFVGVTIPIGATDAQMRALITGQANTRRGAPATLISILKSFLTGTQHVDLIERSNDAYSFKIVSYAGETPGGANGDAVGSALFNGTVSGYISTPAVAALNIQTAFTINAWIKLNAVPASGIHIVYGKDNSTLGRWGIVGVKSDGVTAVLYAEGNGVVAFDAGPITIGQWTMITITQPGGSAVVTGYINGALVGTGANVVAFATSTAVQTIGERDYQFNNDYFTGDIAQVSVHPTALTATQISSIYTAQGNGTYDPTLFALAPVAWWELSDAVNSTTAIDSSGNGYTGTVYSGVTFGQTSPISGGNAAALAKAALIAAKPAGLVMTYVVQNGLTWAGLTGSWGALTGTWASLANEVPV